MGVESGVKYFILGSFSSSLFLFGSSLLYGLTGTINFEDFKDLFFNTFELNNKGLINVKFIQFSLLLIISSFFFKLLISPFNVWAVDVYENSPSPFFFSVIPKVSIFVVFIRIFFYSFYGFIPTMRHLTVIFVILSFIMGSFGGILQKKLKSLLVYSSISHMGYCLMAFCSGTLSST